MAYWAAVFFVIAVVAAVFAFSGIVPAAVGIARVLFVAFLIIAGVALLLGRRSVVA